MRANIAAAQDLQSGDMRLDASYHASSGHQALRVLRGAGKRADRLDQVCFPNGIFIPGRFRRVYVDNPQYGVRWLSPSDMQKADLSGLGYVSRKYTPNLDILRIQKGWILLSRSGTIGNLVYVRSDMDGLIGSDDIIRIAPDPQQIYPGYLYALLSSPAMVKVIQQKTYGAVVPHIESHHVVDLPIPRIDPSQEEEIHRLIEQAAELRVNANQLINLARRRVNQLIDLPELTREEALTKGCWNFSVPGKQFGQFSLAAWTYNPVSQKLTRQIESGPYKELGELIEEGGIYYGHQFKRIEASPAAGVILLSQSDVFQERPQGRWISKKSVNNYHDYEVSDGTILVAAQGTMGDNELFGHCQFSHGNFAEKMITQHILRVVPDPNKVSPGYLFAFLSSSYGFQLFRRTSCGTKLMGFILELVGKIPVPLVERSDQDEIGRMIDHAYECRGKAIELENQAQEVLRTVLF